jgi:hypothetical protein
MGIEDVIDLPSATTSRIICKLDQLCAQRDQAIFGRPCGPTAWRLAWYAHVFGSGPELSYRALFAFLKTQSEQRRARH